MCRPSAECSRQCKNNGDVGLVLFYADMILGSVDERLIELADLLNFPIILLPGKNMGLKYSDVIDDVMEAVFYDQRANRYFISSAMERLAQTVEEKRTPSMPPSVCQRLRESQLFPLRQGVPHYRPFLLAGVQQRRSGTGKRQLCCSFGKKADGYGRKIDG